jgi:hypothetical protein
MRALLTGNRRRAASAGNELLCAAYVITHNSPSTMTAYRAAFPSATRITNKPRCTRAAPAATVRASPDDRQPGEQQRPDAIAAKHIAHLVIVGTRDGKPALGVKRFDAAPQSPVDARSCSVADGGNDEEQERIAATCGDQAGQQELGRGRKQRCSRKALTNSAP